MARRMIIKLCVQQRPAPRILSKPLPRQLRRFRIAPEIAAIRSLLPFHSTVASARFVSGLSSGLVPGFQGYRTCSTSSHHGSVVDEREKVIASEAEDSFSEGESFWSHDEEDSESGSEFEEGDTFLNDNDLWEEENAKGRAGTSAGDDSRAEVKSTDDEKDEEASPFDPMMEDLARVLPDVDPDAMKKAEEKFRQQQGEAARVRREAGAYLRAMKKEYDARSLVQDEHCQKVHAKLAYLKPDPDGRYRNLMEVVSDMDVLLEAYRRVKAGPGGDPSKVPLDNISMDWFCETQSKLRDGSFQLRPIKVVEVEKRELGPIERKAKKFRHFHRRPRQPF